MEPVLEPLLEDLVQGILEYKGNPGHNYEDKSYNLVAEFSSAPGRSLLFNGHGYYAPEIWSCGIHPASPKSVMDASMRGVADMKQV